MSDLDRLFYWCGIAADYVNYKGEKVSVPEENRLALLETMGLDLSSSEAISQEAYRLDAAPWKSWLNPLSITHAFGEASVQINIGPDDAVKTFAWSLLDNKGKSLRRGTFSPADLDESGEYYLEQERFSRRALQLGILEPNYYTLCLSDGDVELSTTIAAVPPTVQKAQWAEDHKKIWGVIIQLYTLTSERNWGIGDFSDLNDLIEKSARKGMDVIGLNPLHALSAYLDEYYSPYSPSDRRFISPLYIDPELEAEFDGTAKTALNRELLAELKAANTVDYVKVRDVKYAVLEVMFSNLLIGRAETGNERFSSFEQFVLSNGNGLLEFAFYEACHQRWSGAQFVLKYGEKLEDVVDVLFSSDGDALANLDDEKAGACKALLFHCYLQWLAFGQLAVCQRTAMDCGMAVGLIRDLAVGADGGGAEVTANESLFCRDSAVGAPPDPFAATGQNWGLPPVSPAELRASGFKHYIELLRKNMQHCGALRIDHAMSIMRLWWCPPETTADHGAYVYYPFEEMLGLLALESHLNKCVIVGEDLGVVPDEFREALRRVGVFSNKVFYFEKVHHSELKHPKDYDQHALAMVNNHDVPTLVSWWNGSDLVLRDRLDLLEEGVDYLQVCGERRRDKEQLLGMLYREDLYPESWHGKTCDEIADEALIESILILASRTASQLFVIQLEDLLMMDAPVNVPGTFHEHANWQRKLTTTVSDMFGSARIDRVLENINSERKNHR